MVGRRFLLASALCVLLAGCPASRVSPRGAFRPTFSRADCPRDVEVQLLVEHSCGYLMVPEDRSHPDRATLKLLVVTFTPPGPLRPDPVLIVGDEIGGIPNYGFHQAEAERLHRVVFVLEQRGTDHSQPTLSCPGLDGGRAAAPGVSPKPRMFLSAVTACRTHLVAAGLDPAAFDLRAMAADVQDLRRTLHIAAWNLASFGSSSLLAFEVIREDPDHVRAAFLDSPWVPPIDDPEASARATGLVMRDLFRACGTEPSCRAWYPDLRGMWRRVVAGLARHSLEARVGHARVPVDDGLFIRVLRTALASDDVDLRRFPAILDEASRRRLDADLSTVLASHPAMCVGYRTGCGTTSTPVSLSALCGVPTSMIGPATDGVGTVLPGMRDAFSANPYAEACARWTHRRSASDQRSLERSTVPILLLSGQFDPFDPPSFTEELARSLPVSFRIDLRGANRAALEGRACALRVTGTWLDHPSSPPPGAGCLFTGRIRFVPDR